MRNDEFRHESGRAFIRTIEGTVNPEEPLREKLARLERIQRQTYRDVIAARKALRTFTVGRRAFLSGLIVLPIMFVLGMALAIVTSLVGFDAGVAAGWLMGVGFLGSASSAAGMFAWQYMWKIETDDRGRTVRFTDPAMALELAEMDNSRALAQLTEHQGLIE